MYSDAKRIHLLEKLKSTKDDAVWHGLEQLLEGRVIGMPTPPSSILMFANEPTQQQEWSTTVQENFSSTHGPKKFLNLSNLGEAISREDMDDLDRIIEEGCSRIFPSEWVGAFDDYDV